MTPESNNPSSPPPVVRAGARKPLTLVACGIVLAGLLLVVVFTLDRGRPVETDGDLAAESTELIQPERLTQEELESGTSRPLATDEVRLPAGGWIQIADAETGRAAQQYRFARLDPNPPGKGPGWFHMTEPVFEFYLSGGRVVLLTGDSALTYRPNRAIKSGTLTGNVLIRMFDGVVERTLDLSRDEPVMLMRTPDAEFDNLLGEVRCDGEIHLETRTGVFEGRQMKMLINDQENVIELLEVKEVDSVRLAGRQDAQADTGDRSSTPETGSVVASAPPSGAQTPAPPAGAEPPAPPASAPPPAAGELAAPQSADGQDVQFYRLTLHDDVQIVQGETDQPRTVQGDSLSIIFTMESEGFGPMLAIAPVIEDEAAYEEALTKSALPAGPQGLETIMLSMAVASVAQDPLSIAPPPSPDDTIITCTGPLTMVPLEDMDERLTSPKDAIVELLGEPVRLNDPAGDAEATCASLQYHTLTGRLELLSSDVHGLKVESPQLQATGERFWLNESEQQGGFIGTGEARLLEAPSAEQPAGPSAYGLVDERLHITWEEGVDLAFEGERGRQTLGPIRSATFKRDVLVRSNELALSAEGSQSERARRAAASGAPPGEMRCESLAVGFTGDAGAQAVDTLLATGSVEVTDHVQTLWAGTLNVLFLPPAEQRDAAEAGDEEPASVRASDVDRIIAERDVQLLLPDGQRAFGDRLEIDGTERIGVLSGEDVRLVDRNSVIDHARKITVNDVSRRYALSGKGRLRRFDRTVLPAEGGRLEPMLLDHLPGSTEELRVTWRDGVDVMPLDAADGVAPESEGPSLARFNGDVQITTPELRLTHADTMEVRFGAGRSGEDSVTAIDAFGAVHARSAGDKGEIRSDRLHVDVGRNDRGESVPERMIATGNVHVEDEQQSMWTQSLTVTFREIAPTEEAKPAAEPTEFADARVEVDTIVADQGVRLLLSGGEHVYADRLVARPIDEGEETTGTAELTGERVMVIAENFLLDRCRRLELDRTTGQHIVRGPGQFFSFDEPLDLPGLGMETTPPTIPAEASTEASWTDSALYIEGAEGSGTLELRGNVHAESTSKPLEFDMIDANALSLDFVEVVPADGGEARKELSQLVARGDAKIESRTWRDVDRLEKPRVFYVAGQHISHDPQTLESHVIGDGTLLIRDEWGAEDGGDEAESNGFGRKGTTLFRWKRELHLTRAVDDVFTIVMTGDVETVHRDLENQTSTITCQRLEATVVRLGAADDSDQPAADGALNIGGPMETRRLYGEGGVFIRTPEREVVCDMFDYNTQTGLAKLSAVPGRMVSILTAGSADAVVAEHVLWDMTNDRIRIERAGGSGAP